ncbi:MAG: DNA polymerase [Bdellovibrionota bacterium]
MERNGIKIDKDHLAKQSKTLQKQVDQLEKKIHNMAGKDFNIKSPKQLGPILFEELKIQETCNVKKVKKTKTGYATDYETMQKYTDHPIVVDILAYRNLTKLISTYIDALPTLINAKTGHIHTSFNQTVAATGRLSSSDPNLQNIPIRSEEGRRIREAFVASEKNWQILSADYSQIELRLLAHLSGDPTLIEMFQSGQDVHTQTASKIFDIALDQVSSQQRARAKTINFGIIYGMGPQRLARENKISLDEAKQFIENYFATFSHVQDFFTDVLEKAKAQGYVTTLTGRQRPVDLKSKNPMVKAFAERIAINTPLQGSAADLIKLAMIDIHQELQTGNWQARMLIQVHDELVFEAPTNECKKLEDMVKTKMANAMQLRVPLISDAGSGDNGSSAH